MVKTVHERPIVGSLGGHEVDRPKAAPHHHLEATPYAQHMPCVLGAGVGKQPFSGPRADG